MMMLARRRKPPSNTSDEAAMFMLRGVVLLLSLHPRRMSKGKISPLPMVPDVNSLLVRPVSSGLPM